MILTTHIVGIILLLTFYDVICPIIKSIHYLLLNGHGHILSLLQQLSQTHTTVQQLLGGGVQVRAELRERGDLTVLSQLQFHRTGHLGQAN